MIGMSAPGNWLAGQDAPHFLHDIPFLHARSLAIEHPADLIGTSIESHIAEELAPDGQRINSGPGLEFIAHPVPDDVNYADGVTTGGEAQNPLQAHQPLEARLTIGQPVGKAHRQERSGPFILASKIVADDPLEPRQAVKAIDKLN
jgi:hypothetical protein